MIHNIVYRIVNKSNGRIYIGSHSTNNLDDGYFGSGTIIRRAIKKYGIENFEKIILFDYDNRSDMLKIERILVDNHFVNQSDTYNLRRGGMGGQSFGHIVTNETRDKIRVSRIGKKFSEETRKRISESHKGQGIGRTIPQDIREKISKANKGKIRSEDVKQSLRVSHIKMRGRKLTEEHKEKIRQANIISWSNPELRKKLGESRIGNQWAKGYKMTDEQKKKMSQSKIGKKGSKQSDEVKQKHAEATRRAWENPEHKEMRRKAIKDSWTPERRAAQAIITRERNFKRYGNLERVE